MPAKLAWRLQHSSFIQIVNICLKLVLLSIALVFERTQCLTTPADTNWTGVNCLVWVALIFLCFLFFLPMAFCVWQLLSEQLKIPFDEDILKLVLTGRTQNHAFTEVERYIIFENVWVINYYKIKLVFLIRFTKRIHKQLLLSWECSR